MPKIHLYKNGCAQMINLVFMLYVITLHLVDGLCLCLGIGAD